MVVICSSDPQLNENFLLEIKKRIVDYNYELILINDESLSPKRMYLEGLEHIKGDMVCLIDVECPLNRFRAMIEFIDKIDLETDAIVFNRVVDSKLFRKSSFGYCVAKRKVADFVLEKRTFSRKFLKDNGFEIAVWQ